MRTFLIVMAVLLGVLVVGVVVVGPSAIAFLPTFGAGEEALAVRLAPVTSRELLETVSAPGELDPEIKVDVSAEVSARVNCSRRRRSTHRLMVRSQSSMLSLASSSSSEL